MFNFRFGNLVYLLKISRECYGSVSNSFRYHFDGVVNDRLDYNEVASLLVWLIHKKRLSEYKKLVKKSSNVENVLLRRFDCYEGLTSYEDWMDIYVDDPCCKGFENALRNL